MSKNREKVFDDPLSMFGPPSSAKDEDSEPPAPAPVKKADPVPVAKPVVKPVVAEEPLSASVVKKSSILDEPSPAGKKSSLFNDYSSTTKKSSIFDDPNSTSPAPSSPIVVPTSTTTESAKPESIFREIDVNKVTLKEKKKKVVEEATYGQVSQAEKGLGFSTDLWSNDLLASTASKPNKDLDDLFSGSTAKSKDYNMEDSLFGGYDPKKPVKKDDDISKLRMGSAGGSTEVKSINIRGTKNDEEESTLQDLAVSKLLEREEDLDFDTFGKVKMDNNVHITKTIKKNKDVFDLGSEDYLNELEAVANKRDTTTSSTTSSKPKVVAVQAAKEIDMSSLDLDAYISAQQASSGGGLFD